MQLGQIPGYFVHVGPLQPTLGIRPDQPYLDLRYGRDVGRGFFTDDFVVIACADNGLIAVKVNHPEQDLIVGLDDQIAAHMVAGSARYCACGPPKWSATRSHSPDRAAPKAGQAPRRHRRAAASAARAS
jgi:hypothetical protein